MSFQYDVAKILKNGRGLSDYWEKPGCRYLVLRH